MKYLAKKLAIFVTVLMSLFILSTLIDLEQQPSATGRPIVARQETGTDNVIDAPEGIITVSVLFARIGGLGVCTNAIDEGLEGGADAVGTDCCEAIASCSKHFTSSADERSTGACPS